MVSETFLYSLILRTVLLFTDISKLDPSKLLTTLILAELAKTMLNNVKIIRGTKWESVACTPRIRG